MRTTTRLLLAMAAAFVMAISYYGPAQAGSHIGTVVDAIDGGGYTYLNVDVGGEKIWLAGPQTTVTKGATVGFDEQLWMPNFHSKALDRTFDKLLFVNAIQVVEGGAPAAAVAPAAAPLGKPVGKFTVEELITKRAELSGKVVELTGEVVKVSENIMGRTWVHISDGTGAEGSRKMVFRSIDGKAAVSDTVTAKGRLETDRDFGFGYFYPVIVEDATFTK